MLGRLAVLAMLLTGCSQWAKAACTAMASDTATTLYMSDGARWDGKIREGDPALGATPSATTLVVSLAIATAVVVVVDHALPRRAQPWFGGTIAVVEGEIALHNFALAQLPGAMTAAHR